MASLLSLRCVSAGLSYPLPQVQLVRPIFPPRFKVRMEGSAVSAAAAYSKDTGSSIESDTIIQYVVLRRDLIDTWPLGSVVTQGCHASVAAIWSRKDDPFTLQYCDASNLDSMHKVTLEVKGQAQIVNLSEKLKSGGIDHKLWIEQPENIPTCLATKPYPKSIVSSFFKKLKLSGNRRGDFIGGGKTSKHLRGLMLAFCYKLNNRTISCYHCWGVVQCNLLDMEILIQFMPYCNVYKNRRSF